MSLAKELNLKRAFKSVEEEALLSVFATYDLLNRHIHCALRRQGLTIPQFNVLRILRGSHPDGLPLMTVARRMIVRYPNVTRLTDRLETDGLIERVRCTQDRRVVRAKTTESGLEMLKRIDHEIDDLHVTLMRGADGVRLKALIEILEAVRLPLRDGYPADAANGECPEDRENDSAS